MAGRARNELSNMSYEVKTRVFEGPFDLLLQLITSHQVAITELRLADIVGEYLAYLDAMRELDMEVTSEFLLIAATLVQLKARHLLPGDPQVDLDEELALAEERDRLLARLLSCLTFKDVAPVLRHRLENGARYVPRMAGLDSDIKAPLPDIDLGITTPEFGAIARRVLILSTEPDLDHLDLELPSVEAAIADLQARVAEGVEADFDELVAHLDGSRDMIAYFLAMLELVRWGALRIGQDHELAPITVGYRPGAHREGLVLDANASEWAS